MIKFLLIICTLFVSACTAEKQQCDWRVSSEKSNFFIDHINKNNYTRMCINQNQIYIKAKIKHDQKKIYLFFDSTLDLGRGGLMLDWDNFSKRFPIAQLKKNNNSYTLHWYGFYNKKKKTYVWSHQHTDLNIDGNQTIYQLKKCCY